MKKKKRSKRYQSPTLKTHIVSDMSNWVWLTYMTGLFKQKNNIILNNITNINFNVQKSIYEIEHGMSYSQHPAPSLLSQRLATSHAPRLTHLGKLRFHRSRPAQQSSRLMLIDTTKFTLQCKLQITPSNLRISWPIYITKQLPNTLFNVHLMNGCLKETDFGRLSCE